MKDKALSSLPLGSIRINDRFWSPRIDTAEKVSIPYMWNALNDNIPDIPPSHCIKNFKIAAGMEEGEFKGYVFQDSDLYKWIEAVAFSLEGSRDEELEKIVDEVVELIEKAQLEDGYIDTYYIINGLENRWTDLASAHEMYCAGHLMEAAVAYYNATGKRKLLEIACRFADHIDERFGPEEGKLKGYPGHQEIEIGLVKLYKATGKEKYLKLAKFFLDERGKQPYYFDIELERRGLDPKKNFFFNNHGPSRYSYQQAHLPVREQKKAVGHAVRAAYMYTAMADVGSLSGDETLLEAAKTLFKNIVEKQMYVTGGIGSMGEGEAFTFDYDLPNDRMYNETCAAIALVMFAQRLQNIERNARYADIVELALYNGVLSGIQLDGTKYFYVNPLEVWPERSLKRDDMRYVKPERQGWFGCACCPPNILRTLTGLGQYIYSKSESGIFVNLFVGSEVEFEASGRKVVLKQSGNYPWDGNIVMEVYCEDEVSFDLNIRIPGWCKEPKLSINGVGIDLDSAVDKGYALINRAFKNGDRIELLLPMPVERIRANDNVPFNAGKVAVKRGPIVYCLEEKDNGNKLWNLLLNADRDFDVRYESELLNGVVTLSAQGIRESQPAGDDSLYSTSEKEVTDVVLKFIPYYSWGNRGVGEMMVWVRENK